MFRTNIVTTDSRVSTYKSPPPTGKQKYLTAYALILFCLHSRLNRKFTVTKGLSKNRELLSWSITYTIIPTQLYREFDVQSLADYSDIYHHFVTTVSLSHVSDTSVDSFITFAAEHTAACRKSANATGI